MLKILQHKQLLPEKLIVKKRKITGPTKSETWETVVPLAPPRYRTLDPGFMKISLIPPIIAAAFYK